MTYPGSSLAERLRRTSQSVTAPGPVHGRLPPEGAGLGASDHEQHRTSSRRPRSRRRATASRRSGVRRAVHVRPPRPGRQRHASSSRPTTTTRSDVYLDKIVFKPMPDAAAAVAALEAGDIQVLDNVSHDTPRPRAAGLEPAGAPGAPARLGGRAVSTSATGTALGNLPYANVGTPLASSPELRQAFEEAIDRQTLNRVVFGGLYQPSCTLIPPANTLVVCGRSKMPVHAVRPGGREEARRRVGHPEPDACTCSSPNATDRLRLAQFIQARGGGGRDQRRHRHRRQRHRARREGRAATSTRTSAASGASPGDPSDQLSSASPRRGPGTRAATRARAWTSSSRTALKATQPKARAVVLPRRAADDPRRSPCDRPVQHGHVRGGQHERHRGGAHLQRCPDRRERAVHVAIGRAAG